MLLINFLGFFLIGLIVWWFWLYEQDDMAIADGVITVTVKDGVYQPSRIQIFSGEPATLRFIREDESPCAGTVVFDDFNISQELPLNKAVDINITPKAEGKYSFTCQMQMYRGEIIVENNREN